MGNFDDLQFRVLETLQQAKGVPLTAKEIAARVHEARYHRELLDTVVWKVTAKCHALKDQGKLRLSEARGVGGALCYELPQRMMFPAPVDGKPANPALPPEIAERIVAAQPKAPPPPPKAPPPPPRQAKPKQTGRGMYTVGMQQAVLDLIDGAPRPLTLPEVVDQLKHLYPAEIPKEWRSSLFAGHLFNLKRTGRIIARKPLRKRATGGKLEYLTRQTGKETQPVRPSPPPPEIVHIAEPRTTLFRPVKQDELMQEVKLRLPADKHLRITAAAEKFGVSVHDFCIQAIDFALANTEGDVR